MSVRRVLKLLEASEREERIAKVLAPLGERPLTVAQARRAGQLLGVHWATVYRLRRRYQAERKPTALLRRRRGPKPGNRLPQAIEGVIAEVIDRWLPSQKELAHPGTDTVREVLSRCAARGLEPPSKNTVLRRMAAAQAQRELDLALDPAALVAPGALHAVAPLDLVQIDHTLADVVVVDEGTREPWKRPWLSVALDVATRCVVGFSLSMERPNAGSVALLLTRVALPKAGWLQTLAADIDWPMHGIPAVLHMDNAAEFRGKALRSGASQYSIDLQYRPVRRPNFGGHVERVMRTLMERLRALPGATGGSTKGRKGRNPEATAAMTLPELERWLAIEIGQRYHNSEHRGLAGGTPAGAWKAGVGLSPPRVLPPEADAALQFIVRFLPVERRTIQRDGLTFMRLRYWHPIFAAWREQRRPVLVRYHPDDLSRLFVSAGKGAYVEARFADVRRPPITAWQQRSACRQLRASGHSHLSEALIFEAIAAQTQLVRQARSLTRQARRGGARTLESAVPLPTRPQSGQVDRGQVDSGEVDYSKPSPIYEVEQW